MQKKIIFSLFFNKSLFKHKKFFIGHSAFHFLNESSIIFLSSSEISSGYYLITIELHFLSFLTFFSASNLHNPIHSPSV